MTDPLERVAEVLGRAADGYYQGLRATDLSANLINPLLAVARAAEAVIGAAETDDNFDGDFEDWLVPVVALDALRDALADLRSKAEESLP